MLQTGKLIIAANSLGNDKDIPVRTLSSVQSADVLVFEEDRPARKLLKAARVTRSYFKHNEHQNHDARSEVKAALLRGETILYASDCGTPSVSDPGRDLVEIAFAVNATIEIIPGPSSITAALSACPFNCSKFLFEGFLPRKEEERRKKLAELKNSTRPIVILDTPYRLKALLESCMEVFSPDKKYLLAIDISGENEKYISGSILDLQNYSKASEEKLNFVLIIEKSSR